MKTLLIALATWIMANSPYSMDLSKLPLVEIISQQEIDEIYFGRKVDSEEEESGIKAIYDIRDKKIYLIKKWKKDHLLHELVHWFQFETGADKEAECRGELEGEAYRLQKKYGKEKNIPWEFDDFYIKVTSLCTSL